MRFKKGDVVQVISTIDGHECDTLLLTDDDGGWSIEPCASHRGPVLGVWWLVTPTDVLLYRRPSSRKRKAGP